LNYRILIIIPLYNEEENIEMVLNDLNNFKGNYDFLFINDNSTDNTLVKLQKLTDSPILQLSVNLGVGGAVQAGFKYADLNNYDFAVQFDGDGQHMASEIYYLLKPLTENNADISIGSRFLNPETGYKGKKTRKFGIKFFKYLNYLLTGIKITDSTSGFRAYNKAAISFLSGNYPSDYPEPEAIMLFHRKKFRVTEVPAEMRRRVRGKSSISGLLSFYYMIKVTTAIIISYFQKHK